MKITLINLGCPKNQKDGELALASFIDKGFSYTKELSDADVVIVNTCGFIDDAKEESIREIINCANIKMELKAPQILIAMGCLTQVHAEELKVEIPELDIILGVNAYYQAYDVFCEFIKTEKKRVFVEKPCFLEPGNSYIELLKKTLYTPETFLYSDYVKIAEGCDNKCTYCSIPGIRGNLSFRDEQNIVAEIKMLTARGVKEVVLVAQDLVADIQRLKKLLKLIAKLPVGQRPSWLRLMYCNPWGLDDELIDIISNEDWIVKYIDMPIQHISDKVLKLMGRKGDSRLIRSNIEKLKKAGIVLRTTVLTGFPGENDKDFEELKGLVSEGHFHWLGVFVFSAQEGTPAFKMRPKVPKKLAIERRNELDRLQFEVTTALNNAYIGKKLPVLIVGEPVDGVTEGRIFAQAPIIDGVVRIQACVKGPFEDIIIEDTEGFDLIGRLK
jgi:ribosomal protein S12 methylthiotransferase